MKYELILTVGIKGLFELFSEEESEVKPKTFWDTLLNKEAGKSKGKEKEVQAVFKSTTQGLEAGFPTSFPLMLYIWNDLYEREIFLINGRINTKNGYFVSTINLYFSANAKSRGVSSVDEARSQLKEEIATRLESKHDFVLVEIKVIDAKDSPDLSS